MTLPDDPHVWPTRWADDYAERACICEYDGRMTQAEALRFAEADVRRVAERE